MILLCCLVLLVIPILIHRHRCLYKEMYSNFHEDYHAFLWYGLHSFHVYISNDCLVIIVQECILCNDINGFPLFQYNQQHVISLEDVKLEDVQDEGSMY